jgi:hypothetical protein
LSSHERFAKWIAFVNKNSLTQICVFNDLIAGFLEGITNSTSLGYKTVVSSESQTCKLTHMEYPTVITHTSSVEIIGSQNQSTVFTKNTAQKETSDSDSDTDTSESLDSPPKLVQKRTVIRVKRKQSNIKTK